MDKVLLLLMCLLVRTRSTEDIGKKDLVLIPSDTTEENSDEENMVETSFKDDSDFEMFQATDEWQTVKEGQAIPQGLHVQMNLQTGEKRAKLLDENKETEKKQTNKNEDNVKHLPKQEYVKIDQNIISKQRLKEVLKDFKDKFHNEDLDNEKISEHAKTKYRSMEEIKKEFDGVNIWVKKDIEIILELVEKLNGSESTKQDIIHALEELEYYVHQIDNARDLDIIGGLGLLMNFLNQSYDDEIKSRAALVIGAAAQSNKPVQLSLLDSGILPLLTRLVSNRQSSLSTRKNSLYALSSVLRLFQKGTQKFLKIGGLSILATLFQESGNDPLRIKSLTLLVDLLTEQMDGIRKKAKEMGIQDYEKATLKAPLFKTLYQEGWCDLAASLMTSPENDKREKILQGFHVLWPVCRSTFRKNNLSESLGKWRQEWQEEINKDNEDDTGYLESLVKLVDNLVDRL